MRDIRLDKYVALTLNKTRSQAKALINNKKILVNGEVIRNSDYSVKNDDIVYYEDKRLEYEENIYLMMNKPKGYVCSTNDNLNKTVLELIKEYNTNRMLIVGRLDIDTTGLLLLTTDGSFVHKLTSPNKDIDKKYYVVCDKDFTSDDMRSFTAGIIIDLDNELYKCKSAKLEILDNKNEAYITISEGKFHQVKKMCQSVGKKVLDLKRVAIGGLTLDDKLELGMYRKLTNDELELLK